MKIQTTQQAEKERIANKWEYQRGGLVKILREARDMGWEQDKVQVRREMLDNGEFEYIIEPYEPGCGCKGKIRFQDYFGD